VSQTRTFLHLDDASCRELLTIVTPIFAKRYKYVRRNWSGQRLSITILFGYRKNFWRPETLLESATIPPLVSSDCRLFGRQAVNEWMTRSAVRSLFNEYCPNCPQAVQWILPKLSTVCSMYTVQTVHRLSSRYCPNCPQSVQWILSKLSTGCPVDIAQTVHSLFNEYCPNCPHAVQWILAKLSTVCSMNTAQTVHRLSSGYLSDCPQPVQWILSKLSTCCPVDIGQTVRSLFNEYCTNCRQVVQWILPKLSAFCSMNIVQTVHRLSRGYYPDLSTGCPVDFTQSCLQAVQWILPNTVHRMFNEFCPKYCPQTTHFPRLSIAYSAVLNTGYWVFSGLQIKSKFILWVRYTVRPFHIKLTVVNIVQYYWCLRVPLTLRVYEYASHLWASKSSVCKFIFTVAFTFFFLILEGKLKNSDKFLLICS